MPGREFASKFFSKRDVGADISGIAAFTEYLYLPNNMVRECFGILKDVIH
ncbi:MAG: hypothetical protein K6E13_05545 [Lachnospiraceae bacterium]|nr:hypothetical protein [Lachnospiraceae bacterium]